MATPHEMALAAIPALTSLDAFILARKQTVLLRDGWAEWRAQEGEVSMEFFEDLDEGSELLLALLVQLEERGVLGDIEQNLHAVYEPTRRPGIAQNYEAPLGGYARTGETL